MEASEGEAVMLQTLGAGIIILSTNMVETITMQIIGTRALDNTTITILTIITMDMVAMIMVMKEVISTIEVAEVEVDAEVATITNNVVEETSVTEAEEEAIITEDEVATAAWTTRITEEVVDLITKEEATIT